MHEQERGDRKTNSLLRECKAIALDLDGTLLNEEGDIPLETARTLSQVQRAGMPVVLASSRPPQSILELTRGILQPDAVVALNGSWISDMNGNVTTHAIDTDSKVAMKLDRVEELDLAVNLYTADGWFVNSLEDHRIEREADAVGYAPTGTLQDWKRSSCHASQSVLKLLFIGSEKEFSTLQRECQYPSFLSKSGYLDVTGLYTDSTGALCAVTKLTSLQQLAAPRGLNVCDFLFFGDGENDASLLHSSGYGVAIKGGHPKAVSVADEVLDLSIESIGQYIESSWKKS